MLTARHRSAALDKSIRREIITVLQDDAQTIPAAVAVVANGWSARRERRGDSPTSVLIAASMVFQVGAELAQELTA